MLTAAKLIAALGFAFTALIAGFVFASEHTIQTLGFGFLATNWLVGFFVGWFTLGQFQGKNLPSAALFGIVNLVFLLVGCGLVFAGYDVILDLGQFISKDTVDLPLRLIELTFENVIEAFSTNVAISLLIGGIISGIASYRASLVWQ